MHIKQLLKQRAGWGLTALPLALLIATAFTASPAYAVDPPEGSGSSKGSIEKRVEGADNDGRGSNAASVVRGQVVTYSIRVNGAPPGQSGKKVEVTDNYPQHMQVVAGSFDGQGTATFDANKITWKDLTPWDGREFTLRLKLQVSDNAPCNHVATNVAHVNGLGSDQAQVRVTCPGVPAAASPAPSIGPGSGQQGPFSVQKTAQFEGQKLDRIDAKHLGKMITYNILVQHSGQVSDRVVRIVEDMGAMCGDLLGLRNADGTLNNQNVEITRDNPVGARPGFQVTVNDNCQITILGDAKEIVGSRFHIKVRLRPGVLGTNPVLTNRVNVAVLEQLSPRLQEESVAGVLAIALAPEVMGVVGRVPPVPAPPAAVTLPVAPLPGDSSTAGAVPADFAAAAPAVEADELAAGVGTRAPATLPRAGGPAFPAAPVALFGAALAALGWRFRRR